MTAKAKIQFEADTSKAIASLQKLIATQDKQIRKLREAKGAGKKTTDSTLSGISQQVAAYASLAGAVGLVGQAFRSVDQDAKSAASNLLQQEATRQSLAQIQADPKIADRLAKDLGLSVIQAQKTLFSGVSAGFDVKEIENISTVLRPIVEDIPRFFNIIQQQQIQFGQAAGSPKEILNRLLKGAQVSPLRVEELGPESSKTLAALTAISGTPAESIAASAFAAKGQNPAEAITAIRALATFFSKDRSKVNLGLTGSVEALLSEFGGNIQEAQLSITETRARAGFTILAKNLKAFKDVTEQVQQATDATGTATSPLAISNVAAQADPRLRVILKRRQTQAAVEVSEQDVAVRETLQESVFDIVEEARNKRLALGSIGPIRAAIEKMIVGLIDGLASDPSFTAQLLLTEGRQLTTVSGSLEQAEDRNILREMNNNLIEMVSFSKQALQDNRSKNTIAPNAGIE